MLDRWVAEGLLTADQAGAIVEHERSAVAVSAPRRRTATASGRRIPAYAEALGYLGGILALAGLTLLVANYWPDMSTSIRLVLSLVTTIVLLGAGALVHEHIDPALARLRWFLWTLASATAAVFTGVLMIATLEVDTVALVVAACAATVALTSGLLWWGHDRPVQEFLVLGATIVSAATFVTAMTNSGFGGFTAWFLAAIVLAVGAARSHTAADDPACGRCGRRDGGCLRHRVRMDGCRSPVRAGHGRWAAPVGRPSPAHDGRPAAGRADRGRRLRCTAGPSHDARLLRQ